VTQAHQGGDHIPSGIGKKRVATRHAGSDEGK
jgi:hypothetical protein